MTIQAKTRNVLGKKIRVN